MTRKRGCLISAGIFAACVCLALGVLMMLPRTSDAITKANFDRVEKGMTQKEVAAILGMPANENRNGDMAIWEISREEGEVLITFRNGAVVGKWWRGQHETFSNKLRRWLGIPKPAPAPIF